MAKQAETLLKERVLRDLKGLKKTFFYKTQEVARRGVPDIIICLNGWFCALELKTEIGTLDQLQAYKLEKIREADGMAYVVTPEIWPEIFAVLKELSTRRD